MVNTSPSASPEWSLPPETSDAPLSLAWLLALSGSILLLHVLLSRRYGYFRDELYFLDCGRHLAWGYVDMAPMIALFSRFALTFGAPLWLLRSMAAVGAAGIIAITMLIAWRLGGNRFAQALAGLSAMAAPMYLASGSLFTMNIFEDWFWMGCAYVLIRIIQTGNSRLWLWFGVLAGLGLMNKHSTLFFGLAVVAALILTTQRKEFVKPWIWIGGAIALLIFMPNLVWQVQHNFPTLEDLRNVQATGKNVVLSPVAFVVQQILVMNPLLFPVWLSGLWFFLFGRGTKYRPLGWIYLGLLVIFIVLHGKDYYLAPAYPMLFAGGAVAIEGGLGRSRVTAGKHWPEAAIATIVVASGAFLAPAVTPLLSPQGQVAYRQRFHIEDQKAEVNHNGPLPQMFGDQFGWPELVEQVAAIYNALPPEQRAKTAILAGNYGEAGAIDLFGPRYGLPTALSGHQTHYFWGTMGFTGDTVITIQYGPHFLSTMCDAVTPETMHSHPWGMAEENHEIYLCHLKKPLAEMWEEQKLWN